jgi:cyanophycin synthetase
VREIPLLSKGATGYEDVTSRIHQDVRLAAEGLAGLMGAVSLGIDIMAEDISRPETVYFLEANLTPGLSMFKEVGMTPVEIGSAVLGDVPARIPSLLILAARANHARILELAPRSESVGWTDGRQVGLGCRSFPTAVQSPHDGVDLLVRNPAVGSLLVVCDPEELVAEGLPLDRLDSTLITAGASLPAEWEALVRRCSARVAHKSVEGMFA